MISFEDFRIRDGSPVYLQIIDFIERGIAADIIKDGEELPSRRILSAFLGINPNTVQKACRILEERGIIESRSGAKSLITVNADQKEEIRRRLISATAVSMVQNMKQMGMSREDTIALIEAIWKEDDR